MKTNGLNDEKPALEAAPSNIPSTDVFTSYIFSTSNRSLSKYGERLLMEVISVAQEYTIDAALGINKLNFGEKYSEKFAIIDIPVKSLLNYDDTTNYTKAKEAAVELMKIYHTVETQNLDADGNPILNKDGSPQYQFKAYHLLDNVTVNHKPGIVSVKLGEETWSQILDMGKGYARYNLITAKMLDDVVAIRLFQILSNTSEPLYFSLEKIKGILGLSEKYKSNPTGFIRRVIEPAEKEIKEKCQFEVVHDLVYEQISKKGRPSIVGITFSKVLKTTIIKDPSSVIDPKVLNILIKTFGFDDRGLRSNAKLFLAVKEAGHDLEAFLAKIEDKAKEANIPQAYVIKSLQNLLENGAPVQKQMKIEIPVSAAAKPASSTSSRKKAKPVNPKSESSSSIPKNSRLSVNKAEAFSDSGLEEI